MASTKTDKRFAELEQHFAVGNVVFLSYWRSYDKVIAFERNGGIWSVTVQECDKDGNVTGHVRNHSTYPEFQRGDKVVSSVAGTV